MSGGFCGTVKAELTCTNRQESVKDLRMTAWGLVQLIEGSRKRKWWHRLAASSEACLQHEDPRVKFVALSQRSYPITNWKDIHCV